MDTHKKPVGYLRLSQIIGQSAVTKEQADANRRNGKSPTRPRPAIQPLIPVSRATWYLRIQNGLYPRPTKAFGERVAAWSTASIMEILVKAAAEGGP
jgi:predicted DNA-binding transcriptional regulator AlpA